MPLEKDAPFPGKHKCRVIYQRNFVNLESQLFCCATAKFMLVRDGFEQNVWNLTHSCLHICTLACLSAHLHNCLLVFTLAQCLTFAHLHNASQSPAFNVKFFVQYKCALILPMNWFYTPPKNLLLYFCLKVWCSNIVLHKHNTGTPGTERSPSALVLYGRCGPCFFFFKLFSYV